MRVCRKCSPDFGIGTLTRFHPSRAGGLHVFRFRPRTQLPTRRPPSPEPGEGQVRGPATLDRPRVTTKISWQPSEGKTSQPLPAGLVDIWTAADGGVTCAIGLRDSRISSSSLLAGLHQLTLDDSAGTEKLSDDLQKATVASRNSLHWSCKPMIRL